MSLKLGVSSTHISIGDDAQAYGNDFAICIGNGSGNINMGERNIAIGRFAMASSNSNARDNICIGDQAGFSMTGFNNILIGRTTGSSMTNQTNCTIIGRNATSSSSNCTVVGQGATTSGSNSSSFGNGSTNSGANSISIGNTSVQSIEGQVDWGTYSDRRFKKGVEQCQMGLGLIEKLNPVSYNVDCCALQRHRYKPAEKKAKIMANDKLTDEEKAEQCKFLDEMEDMEFYKEANAKRYVGLIAQDVQAVLEKDGCGALNVVKIPEDETTDTYAIKYGMLVMPLINAVKELSSQNKALEARVKALESV